MWKSLLTFTLFPAMALAEIPALLCYGVEPSWSLALDGDIATFSDVDATRQIDFTIPHFSMAEGREWPRALSLIGARDSAVAVLAQRQCMDTASDTAQPYAINLLTQRRGVAILLTGCCRPLEQ